MQIAVAFPFGIFEELAGFLNVSRHLEGVNPSAAHFKEDLINQRPLHALFFKSRVHHQMLNMGDRGFYTTDHHPDQFLILLRNQAQSLGPLAGLDQWMIRHRRRR